ncbi:leucine-rich repeat-containing protein 75A isoform X2 [Apteryx mantelli]|uniref:Leucine-rich repeat-containing protein 75A isoform X2 n=1 Tax=Apteryx mantelli TaxID=2696672 RepID=A0ABM4FLI2_9AVES
MGTRQTKGCSPGGTGESPPPPPRKRLPPRDRGDFLASLVAKSGEKFGRGGGSLPPYHRRVCLIQDMLLLAKQGKQEEATELLRHLRQDLGMESTSLDDVLYRYASFRNLVDPITHDLIISLARYIHCPKPPESRADGEAAGQHGGPVGHPADAEGPGARRGVPAAQRGARGHGGAVLHRADGRDAAAAAAGAGRPAPPHHPLPQRQPAHQGRPAGPHRSPQGPQEVPQRHLDRPRQQRGHLLLAAALLGQPEEALPQARQLADHPGVRRGPAERPGGPRRPGREPGGPASRRPRRGRAGPP